MQACHRLGGTGAQAVIKQECHRRSVADAQMGGGGITWPRTHPIRPTQPHGQTLPLPPDPRSRHFGNCCQNRRLHAHRATCHSQRLRKRMRRPLGQRQSNRQNIRPLPLQRPHLWYAQGQRAGFVKHHHIRLSQPFQCRAVLDQQTLPEQPTAGGRHHCRHCQAQSAGAGDDQHRRRDVDGKARVARQPQPDRKRAERQDVHRRRINSRRPVGKRRIAVTRSFGRSDQIGHPVQGTVPPGLGNAQRKRPGQVGFPRRYHRTRPREHRHGFPGQNGAVHFAGTKRHHPVHRHPATGPHQHQIAGNNFCQRHQLRPLRPHPPRARHL